MDFTRALAGSVGLRLLYVRSAYRAFTAQVQAGVTEGDGDATLG